MVHAILIHTMSWPMYTITHIAMYSEFAPPPGFNTFVEALLSPFWMCIVSAVPVYTLHMMHICVRNCNETWTHVLHSLVSSKHIICKLHILLKGLCHHSQRTPTIPCRHHGHDYINGESSFQGWIWIVHWVSLKTGVSAFQSLGAPL